MKYIGIAKEDSDKWYSMTFMLYNTMLKVTLYTKVTKRPTYYYYNKSSYDYCINEAKIYKLKWFLGIVIKQ